MAGSTLAPVDLRLLSWKTQAGHQTATDGTCLYLRESAGSMISGIVFAIVVGGDSGVCGVWALATAEEWSAVAFGIFLLLLATVFALVLWSSARRGRWMIVYDRGEPGRPGEIRARGFLLPADQVRSISTRRGGGSVTMPRRMVVAELHDGTYKALGPSSVSTWPDHWAQQAATWMGLPYRLTRE